MNIEKGNRIIISAVVILALCIAALIVFFVISSEDLPEDVTDITNRTNISDYDAGYYELDSAEKETISKAELVNRIKKYNAVCGVNDVLKRDTKEAYDCTSEDIITESYVAYIDKGVPYYITNSKICYDEDCDIDEEHYDVYKFSDITDAKSIVSRINQFNNVEFAYSNESGEVYYFTELFDEVEIDDESHYTRLIKIDFPSEFDHFTNVDTNGVLFSTEMIYVLKDGSKYTLSYNQEDDEETLIEYEEVDN